MEYTWDTYVVMTGNEAVVVQHGKAFGAVASGTVDLAPAALTDVASGIGNLPAVNKDSGVLALPHRRAIGQGQVISWITITATFHGGMKKRKEKRKEKKKEEICIQMLHKTLR